MLEVSFFYSNRKQSIDVSPDDKRLSPPIDTCNARGVTSALLAFAEMGEEVGVWASGIRTHSSQ